MAWGFVFRIMVSSDGVQGWSRMGFMWVVGFRKGVSGGGDI